MSKGKMEIKSIQNQPFRYYFAIFFLSMISYTFFSSEIEVKNVSMISTRNMKSVIM